ncbi:MAG: adenosine deaminase [Candidatus Eisenbacteria sp.]|nr:adenosine deaminase [Candidatus Eisenbacteria bacterium]
MLASDLHVHLDGSLRDDTLVALSRHAGLIPATADAEQFIRRLRFRPGMSLASCLSRFDVTVGLLQTRRALERVARELVSDCYVDGVRHAEIRFCPVLHTREGLSSDDAVMSVLGGAEQGVGEAPASAPADRMSARVIISVLEGMSEEEAGALVDLAIGLADFGVAGVDLAGDEALFDPARYARPFARARDAGLGVTVHAGEGGDAANVAAAVEILRANRIGHGVSAASDPGTMSLLVDRGIAVEVCLSSNLHTGAVESLGAHPLCRLVDAGVPVALATDNRFFSDTSLSHEYKLAVNEAGASMELIERSVLVSADAAFLPDDDRAALRELYRASLGPASAE